MNDINDDEKNAIHHDADRANSRRRSAPTLELVAHTSPSRLAVAAALRRLGNALVDHQAPDEVLDRIAREVDGFLPLVEAAPPRPHAFHLPGSDPFDGPPPDGLPDASRLGFPDCVVSGLANPMGVDAQLWREGSEAVCQVTLGPAFEGAPGRAHGGIVAALMDETMGLAMSVSGEPGFTGSLSISFHAPTPLKQPLEIRARRSTGEGRKVTVVAELRSEGRLLAKAEGLFVTVDRGRFLGKGPTTRHTPAASD